MKEVRLTFRRIDPIISTEMVETNIFHSNQTKEVNSTWQYSLKLFDLRIISSFTNLLVDTMTATVDSTILSTHNKSNGLVTLDIARKTRNFRDHNDNLK